MIVLVLSEIWTYNVQLYQNLFFGYELYYDLPTASNVMLVELPFGLFVKSRLSHCVLDQYKMTSSDVCQFENLRMEVIKD